MAGNLCVSVGVSKYTPGLHPLPGAAKAAEDFSSWAAKTGYHSIMISDSQGEPVTVKRIRESMELAFAESEFDRLIFFFAGHGIAVGAANECWLLSNVLRDPEEAIDRVAFYRQLMTYGIAQIGLFADACRTVTALSFDVNGRGVLPNSGADRINPQLDLFLACSLGHPALMVQGGQDSKDRCLFTEVLLEGLSGKADSAVEKIHHRHAPAVLSHTLARFVKSEANNKASLLSRINDPEIQAAFWAPDDVYLKIAQDGQRAVASPPGTPSKEPFIPGPVGEAADIGRLERQQQQTNERMAQDALDRAFPDFLRWGGFGREESPYFREVRHLITETLQYRSDSVAWTRPPAAVALPRSRNFRPLYEPRFSFPVGLSGIEIGRGYRSTLVFLVAENGDWSSVPVFPELLAMVTQSASEVSAITYLERDSFEGPGIMGDYTDILGPLLSGQLRAGDANRVADRIRPFKHVNPLFGVIAAYLYAASGDIDNIVRMADYYVEWGQPVPFDLALLAASRLRWEINPESGFNVFANFREVPEAKIEDNRAFRPLFARRPFPEETEVSVSGFMPWLRQGWSILLSDTGLEVPGILKEIGKGLKGGTFTTISGEAGRVLAETLDYRILSRDALN